MYSSVNSLKFNRELCIGCGRCVEVCPHAVFAMENKAARLAQPQACMECGACQKNCQAHAIQVEVGVGCASALINGALKGKAPSCGCGGGDCC